ncbi:hypothetical protein CIT292_10926 [Citrobacter youngae ATCC 29220]|uniref:DUF7943 domain-containing protein n=2 Tax=Citrobacter youngae TaxID=133448 RepID=D4BJT2_9ENTR|nr:hypothetical protein CIT292_10926 [Citrobacter youngae ATCC 29220]
MIMRGNKMLGKHVGISFDANNMLFLINQAALTIAWRNFKIKKRSQYMNSIFYSVITLLLLTCGVLLLMRSANKNRYTEKGNAEHQPEILSKEEGEDHFSVLMNSITPVWYWRVNHEYIDFIHSTIKRMTMVELNETPGLFDAQRRCSDLNSAVYKYYDNIKKRCLSGEKVPHADLDVLNLRQCFREFSLEAYPALVALVWPEYQRPQIKAEEV